MSSFIFLCFIVAVTVVVSAQQTVDICPGRCNADRVNSENECNNDVTRGICRVQSCDNGFSCSMPANSFTIANTIAAELDFVVEYSWTPDQMDLDTSTRFLGGSAGFGCSPFTDFLLFGGDNINAGGSEFTVVDVQGAFDQGLWSGSTSILAFAGWNAFAQGDVTLKVFLRRKSDGAVVSGTEMSATVSPGVRVGCADTAVGTVKIVRASLHTRVTLEL